MPKIQTENEKDTDSTKMQTLEKIAPCGVWVRHKRVNLFFCPHYMCCCCFLAPPKIFLCEFYIHWICSVVARQWLKYVRIVLFIGRGWSCWYIGPINVHSLLKTVSHPSSIILPPFLKCLGCKLLLKCLARAKCFSNCSPNCFLADVSISPGALFDAPCKDHLFLPSSDEWSIIRKTQSNHVQSHKCKKLKKNCQNIQQQNPFLQVLENCFFSSTSILSPAQPIISWCSSSILCPPTSSSNNCYPGHFLKQSEFWILRHHPLLPQLGHQVPWKGIGTPAFRTPLSPSQKQNKDPWSGSWSRHLHWVNICLKTIYIFGETYFFCSPEILSW